MISYIPNTIDKVSNLIYNLIQIGIERKLWKGVYLCIFITQQVGGLNDKEINEILEASEFEFIDWNLKNAVAELEEVGLNIFEQREDLVKTRFHDIGAIVYYLKAIPWQVPDFTIEKYFDKLLKIHNMIEKLGYVDFTCHRFFIMANKE